MLQSLCVSNPVGMVPKTKEAYMLMHEGVLALSDIELTGIRIDVEYCKRQQAHLTRRVVRMREQLKETEEYKVWRSVYRGDTNIDSNPQLSCILFDHLGFTPSKFTGSGSAAVDKEVLDSIDSSFVQKILDIRKYTKANDTYLEGLIKETVNGYLHPFFNLDKVRTYRSSSSNPNFQNQPNRDPEIKKIIRQAFLPRERHRLGGVDYGGIEVKISACVTEDTLIETIDGPQTVLHIINRINAGEKVYVYGYDFQKDRIAVSLAFEGGITRTKAEVWRITLDNGNSYKLTPDHQFLLRDKTYRELKDLIPGDSLMPFYSEVVSDKSSNVNYRKIYLNNGASILAHDLIAEDVLGIKIQNSELLVHHKHSNNCCNGLSNTHLKQYNLTPAEYKETFNHKVVSVEFYGYEDVYNITVQGMHNYALADGVIVKNCYHEDPNMLRYIHDPTTDMHRDVSFDCFAVPDVSLVSKDMRKSGKNKFTFPEFYGDYYANCARGLWSDAHGNSPPLSLTNGISLPVHLESIGLGEYKAFENHIKEIERKFWEERFAVYGQWKKDWLSAYTKQGYIELLTGFVCQGVMEKNDVINYPVQGVAFHCLLWSLIQMHKWLTKYNFKSKIVGQIHDEMVLDIHESEFDEVLSQVKKIMTLDIREHWKWINVPLEIEGDFCLPGKTWYDKVSVQIQ